MSLVERTRGPGQAGMVDQRLKRVPKARWMDGLRPENSHRRLGKGSDGTVTEIESFVSGKGEGAVGKVEEKGHWLA